MNLECVIVLPRIRCEMKTKLIIALTLFSVLSGCDLIDNFGDAKIESRRFNISSSIEHIKVYNTFDITLVQDNSSFAIITCGEDIQSKVEIRVEDNVLIVDHNVNNRWLRGYEKIKIELHFPSVPVINIYKPCKIETRDTFFTDSFYIIDWGKFSECYIGVNAKFIRIDLSGDNFGSYTIKGNSNRSIFYSRGSAKFNFSEFKTDTCLLYQQSIIDIFIHVNNYLDAFIKSSGNIYYSGNPSINLIKEGEGNLIKN